MARLLELGNAHCRVTLAPEMGGGIARLDALLRAGPVPVLRPWTGRDQPFDLACNVLVPFSNRISGGGFAFDGAFFEMPPNLDGEAFPIHGDGFQRAWEVMQSDGESAVLGLTDGRIGPFRYAAELTYRLEGAALDCGLKITNAGPRLPFGGGFHPWFPRDEDTSLSFFANGVWLEDDRHLPTTHVDLRDAPGWSFDRPRPLPDTWINNAFTGWNGTALIGQGSYGMSVKITADTLDTAIVYSPGAQADFFCFEPVSHGVDAVNQPGQPGVVALEHGQSLSMGMSIAWTQ